MVFFLLFQSLSVILPLGGLGYLLYVRSSPARLKVAVSKIKNSQGKPKSYFDLSAIYSSRFLVGWVLFVASSMLGLVLEIYKATQGLGTITLFSWNALSAILTIVSICLCFTAIRRKKD